MRLIGVASLALALALTFVLSGFGPAVTAQQDGQAIFRYETFGDEQFWTDVLRMQEVVATVGPADALDLGLKVDVEALPRKIIIALRAGQVDLTDPAVTIELLRLNAVVGVRGNVNEAGQFTSIGITCALCHSSVDDSLTPGIGRRLDGWANTDLNVGAIVALSPGAGRGDEGGVQGLGAGKYDPRHHAFDGTNLLSAEPPLAADRDPVDLWIEGGRLRDLYGRRAHLYWNSYVGVGQMGGQGNFSDPRIGLVITQTPDLVTPKLPALLDYQLSLLRRSRPETVSIPRRQRAASVSSTTKRDAPPVTSRRISPTY